MLLPGRDNLSVCSRSNFWPTLNAPGVDPGLHPQTLPVYCCPPRLLQQPGHSAVSHPRRRRSDKPLLLSLCSTCYTTAGVAHCSYSCNDCYCHCPTPPLSTLILYHCPHLRGSGLIHLFPIILANSGHGFCQATLTLKLSTINQGLSAHARVWLGPEMLR